jgi:histidinol-phosphate aminotransferase
LDPTELIKPSIRSMTGYEAPAFSCRVKLDAAESPYLPPPPVAERLASLARNLPYNRYPPSDAMELKKVLAEWYQTSPHRLVLGNGSDELIQLLCVVFGQEGAGVLMPRPTFSMYAIISRSLAMVPREIDLKEDWALDGEAMLEALKEGSVRLVFLASPNNPTGNRFDSGIIKRLIEAERALVVVDEAYGEFARGTLLGLVDEYPHVVVLRSCSKIGLAGLRLGALVGSPQVVEALEKARLPYNINRFTQEAAKIVFEHRELLEEQIEAVRAERERLHKAIEGFPGLRPYPSEANFILFRVERGEAEELFRKLMDAGVLVRYFGGEGPIGQCLRVTVGRPEENDAFLEALAAVWEG